MEKKMKDPKEIAYEITRCSPRAVKLYHEAGLDEFDSSKFTENFTALVMDPDKLKEVFEAITGSLPPTFDVQTDLDVEKFRSTVFFFGAKSLGILRGSIEPAQS